MTLLVPRGYNTAALDDALTTKVAPAQAGFDARQGGHGYFIEREQGARRY